VGAEEQKRECLLSELERLRRQNAELLFYKHVLDQHPVGTIIYNNEGKVVYRNRATKMIDGYSAGELVGLDRKTYLQRLQVMPGGVSKTCSNEGIQRLTEATLKKKGNTNKNVLLTGGFIYDQQDYLLGTCECALDISEYPRREMMYRLLAQYAQDMIYRYRNTSGFKFDYVSPACLKITGYTPEEYYQHPKIFNDIIHPDDLYLISASRQFPVTLRVKHKNGHLNWVEMNDVLIYDQAGNIEAVEGVIRDVTERKKMEQEMANRLQFGQQLIDTIPSPVYYKDVNGLYMGCNVAFEKQLGLTKEAITGRAVHELFPEALAGKYFDMDQQLFKNPGTQIYETSFPHADGTMRDAITHKTTYYNCDGTVAGLVGVITDITDRKKTEKELRVSNESFTSIFDAGPMPMGILSTNGKMLTVNGGFLAATGYSNHEIIGKTLAELNLFVNESDWTDIVNEITATGAVKNKEIKFRNKDGQIWVGLMSSHFIDLDGEQHILAAILDFTDRKRMEQDMARLDRLGLIGQMAAGIGHELRNPITSVRGFIQLLENKEECNLYTDYFKICISELDRANAIITDFLSLARVKPVGLNKNNINTVISDILPLIRADAAVSDKRIVTELEDTPDIPLNEKDIHQLIINLVRNGVEAMPGKGSVTIRTYIEGGKVILAVQDEGSGIDPEITRKLGTPFFTTKDTGTGLGLAVCYSIAQRHSATIDMDTSPGGTSFYVRFGGSNI